MRSIAELVLRLVLVLWVGGMVLFTFLVTPAVFREFGRDEAGRVVGALFPLYFPYNLGLSLVALAAFAAAVWGIWRAVQWLPLVLLLLAIVGNAYVLFSLHPRIRAVKSEIASFETTPPDDPLRRRFARLHGVSAAVNLFLLADGVTLIFLTAGLKR